MLFCKIVPARYPPITKKEDFEEGLKVDRLITGLELYAGHKIDPDNTLLIFDEVQEPPKALSSLEYFNGDALSVPDRLCRQPIGGSAASGTSFPVGKVELLDLCPLPFLNLWLLWAKAGVWRCCKRVTSTWLLPSSRTMWIC